MKYNFRGKTLNGTWVYGHSFYDTKNGVISIYDGSLAERKSIRNDSIGLELCNVEMETGLDDLVIFENDLVKISFEHDKDTIEIIGIAKRVDFGNIIESSYFENYFQKKYIPIEQVLNSQDPKYKVEVAGNVFDNFELINLPPVIIAEEIPPDIPPDVTPDTPPDVTPDVPPENPETKNKS